MAKNITLIPATRDIHTGVPKNVRVKRRVAGYARVSTDSDEQFTSYEAQIDYYTRFIQSNPDWEFVDVYTDEGISGVMTKNREGFNKMIDDALAGKIDLIVTKSVSRFARNTVDSLTTVRKLKEKGVEVFFQKENIYTLDAKGELLIAIMSSLAQEESRSISENVTWGQRKRFADGKVSIPYAHFLGYRKGPDGLPEIVPEEAEIVRRIYRTFMSGKSANAIAKELTAEGIPTPGKKTVWQKATVESILTNEKYKGSALLQKSFTVDFLTKKHKVNEGEVPQYYIEESHPAIIAPEEWEKVKEEMTRRKAKAGYKGRISPFSGKIICGDCGGTYGSKVWHSNSKYRRIIWQCDKKFEGEEKCRTPHFTEEEFKKCFVRAISEYLTDRESVLDDLRYIKRMMTETDFIDEDIAKADKEMEYIAALKEQCIMQSASAEISDDEYKHRKAEIDERYNTGRRKCEALIRERDRMKETANTISGMLFELTEFEELPIKFKDSLWYAFVDHATIYADDRIVFSLRDGNEIAAQL